MASVPLHQEEEEGVMVKEVGKKSCPVKGLIIMGKDPITNVPILVWLWEWCIDMTPSLLPLLGRSR